MTSRILVIEDDDDINNLVCMNLADMNYQVESCHDGAKGYELALTNQFQLIVLDKLRQSPIHSSLFNLFGWFEKNPETHHRPQPLSH